MELVELYFSSVHLIEKNYARVRKLFSTAPLRKLRKSRSVALDEKLCLSYFRTCRTVRESTQQKTCPFRTRSIKTATLNHPCSDRPGVSQTSLRATAWKTTADCQSPADFWFWSSTKRSAFAQLMLVCYTPFGDRRQKADFSRGNPSQLHLLFDMDSTDVPLFR